MPASIATNIAVTTPRALTKGRAAYLDFAEKLEVCELDQLQTEAWTNNTTTIDVDSDFKEVSSTHDEH